jgi:hypothetical protein
MENAKTIFESLAPDQKYSEQQVKDITGLNLGKIKEAKKWLKENSLINSYKGRGGYFSIIEDTEFPEPEVTNTMTREEKIAAAKEEKAANSKELRARRQQRDKVIQYAETQFPGADKIEAYWYGGNGDYFYVWVWNGKKADVFGGYASDIA